MQLLQWDHSLCVSCTEHFDKADESVFHADCNIWQSSCTALPPTNSFTLTRKSSFHDNCNINPCTSAVQRRPLIVINALLFVNCFNFMHFGFVLFDAVCHCAIKPIGPMMMMMMMMMTMTMTMINIARSVYLVPFLSRVSDFWLITRYISQTIQDSAMVTMERQ